jgi:type II secretory pathway component GspD/PulD (secretin)
MNRLRALTASVALLAGVVGGGAGFAADGPPAAPTWTAPPAPAAFRQVQMHVWISETNEQGLRDIGTNLSYKRNAGDGGPIQQVSTNVFDPLNPDFRVTLPAPDSTSFPVPIRPDLSGTTADGIQTQSGAGMTFSIISGDMGRIDGIFRSIERNNDVDLISKPELLAIEGLPAQIQAGGKVPYQSLKYDPKGQAQLTVEFQNIGVNMNITPTIRPDNLVQLNITELNVTDVTRIDNVRGVDLPVFAKRSQTGTVLVPNGQALVIGGLSSRVTRRTERRVPVIGKIPLLGIPFRGRRSEVLNLHLLIFVSPTVVDLRKMAPSSQTALDFWKNGTWQNQKTVETEIDLMQSER